MSQIEITKQMFEWSLEGDPDASLFPNSRNGSYPKTVTTEIGQIIVADVNRERVGELLGADVPLAPGVVGAAVESADEGRFGCRSSSAISWMPS